MKEKSWAIFGKWAYASLAAALIFFGLALVLGRVEGVRRVGGVVLVLLGIWMVVKLFRSPEAEERREEISEKKKDG